MKKSFLFLMCAAVSLVAFAEDEEGKALFESGKAKIAKYDQGQVSKALGQAVDAVEMADYLIDGYNDLMKALPLDTIVETEKDGTPKIDKKTGNVKVKTKYSKDIVDLIAGHHADFGVAGATYYDKTDYGKAAAAWELYASILPNAEFLGAKKPVLHDSLASIYLYYAGLMYSQVAEHDKAISNFKKSLARNTTGAVAAQDIKDGLKYEYYTVSNSYLEAKEYDNSLAVINDAIATDPDEGFYYMFKGVIIETQTNDIEDAIDYYKQSIEKDPTLSMGYFNVGRYYYNKAVTTMNAEENMDLNNDELGKLIDPICKEAKPYIDKSIELDTENTNAEARRIQQWLDDRLAN